MYFVIELFLTNGTNQFLKRVTIWIKYGLFFRGKHTLQLYTVSNFDTKLSMAEIAKTIS